MKVDGRIEGPNQGAKHCGRTVFTEFFEEIINLTGLDTEHI